VIFFQYYISSFNVQIHSVSDLVDEHQRHKSAGTLPAGVTPAQHEENAKLLLEDVRLGLKALDDAAYVALMAFSFPFQILANILFHKLTNRHYTFRLSQAYDLLICALVAVWHWRVYFYK